MADVTVGLLVRIEAKDGKADDVAAFLAQAVGLAEQEPATADWFAIRLGPSTFGVFDTFADDAGRQAHLSGQIASALMAAVGDLVEEPVIEPVDVLARKG